MRPAVPFAVVIVVDGPNHEFVVTDGSFNANLVGKASAVVVDCVTREAAERCAQELPTVVERHFRHYSSGWLLKFPERVAIVWAATTPTLSSPS